MEMKKSSDNTYRIDHAVSATQKAILKAFGMNKGRKLTFI